MISPRQIVQNSDVVGAFFQQLLVMCCPIFQLTHGDKAGRQYPSGLEIFRVLLGPIFQKLERGQRLTQSRARMIQSNNEFRRFPGFQTCFVDFRGFRELFIAHEHIAFDDRGGTGCRQVCAQLVDEIE